MYDSLKIKPHFFFNKDDYTNLLKIWSGKMRVSKKKILHRRKNSYANLEYAVHPPSANVVSQSSKATVTIMNI